MSLPSSGGTHPPEKAGGDHGTASPAQSSALVRGVSRARCELTWAYAGKGADFRARGAFEADDVQLCIHLPHSAFPAQLPALAPALVPVGREARGRHLRPGLLRCSGAPSEPPPSALAPGTRSAQGEVGCAGPRWGPGLGPQASQAAPLAAAPFPEGRRSSPAALHARLSRRLAAPGRPALGPALHHGSAGRCRCKCRSPPRLASAALPSPGEIY